MKVDINNLLGSSHMHTLRTAIEQNKDIMIATPTEEHAFTLLTFLYELGCNFGSSSIFNGRTAFGEYSENTIYIIEDKTSIGYCYRAYFEKNKRYDNIPVIELS